MTQFLCQECGTLLESEHLPIDQYALDAICGPACMAKWDVGNCAECGKALYIREGRKVSRPRHSYVCSKVCLGHWVAGHELEGHRVWCGPDERFARVEIGGVRHRFASVYRELWPLTGHWTHENPPWSGI